MAIEQRVVVGGQLRRFVIVKANREGERAQPVDAHAVAVRHLHCHRLCQGIERGAQDIGLNGGAVARHELY